MAETPTCAYAAVDSAPGLVLTVLYRHAPATEVAAYLGGAQHPPVARCSAKDVRAWLPRLSRTQIFAHLATLRARHLISDDVDGFLLLAKESGKSDHGRAPGVILVEQLAALYEPADRHRTLSPASRRQTDLAERLLREHPLDVALGYARDFVQVLQADRTHEPAWGPAMLKPKAWADVCANVDAWRAERAREEAAAALALARGREKALMAQAYKLIRAELKACASLLRASGYEADEALQEIVLIFHQRLQGAHPYDTKTSALRTYIYMLTRSVLKNRATRADRRRRALGVYAAQHRDRYAELDVEALLVEAPNPPPFTRRPGSTGAPTAGRKTAIGAKTISGRVE